MSHGTPLDTTDPSNRERAAPFMLEAGLSSTRMIGEFWGIVPVARREREPGVRAEPKPQLVAVPTEQGANGSSFISTTIEDALRSAGLMR
jgi:hypothetical protein